MEENLTSLLLADAGLSALVADRISWVIAPQGIARPNVTLNHVSGVPGYTLGGPSGVVESRVQADCWALTYAGARAVSRALKAKLSGFMGVQGATLFHACLIDNERDGFDTAASPDKLFRVSLDFIIHHKEA